MRKLFALALMALTLASFAAGCGKKAEEAAPAATEPAMAADSTAMGGSMDSTSMMSADSTGH
jgi:predicted small lipoprotein YifL